MKVLLGLFFVLSFNYASAQPKLYNGYWISLDSSRNIIVTNSSTNSLVFGVTDFLIKNDSIASTFYVGYYENDFIKPLDTTLHFEHFASCFEVKYNNDTLVYISKKHFKSENNNIDTVKFVRDFFQFDGVKQAKYLKKINIDFYHNVYKPFFKNKHIQFNCKTCLPVRLYLGFTLNHLGQIKNNQIKLISDYIHCPNLTKLTDAEVMIQYFMDWYKKQKFPTELYSTEIEIEIPYKYIDKCK